MRVQLPYLAGSEIAQWEVRVHSSGVVESDGGQSNIGPIMAAEILEQRCMPETSGGAVPLTVARTLFLREAKGGEVTAVFINQSRKRIGPQVVEEAVEKAPSRAKITRRVTPHSLRGTCASHLLWEGANLREIAELLGHNCISTAARYCAPGEGMNGPTS